MFQETLKLTGGNVFRAVTLLGAVGHDDYDKTNGKVRPEEIGVSSNLFTSGSLGTEAVVPINAKLAFQRYGAAVDEINKKGGLMDKVSKSTYDSELLAFHPPDPEEILYSQAMVGGRAAAFQYQVIGGFYMGCQLSKLGLSDVAINPIRVGMIVKAATTHIPGSSQSFKSFLEQHHDAGSTWASWTSPYTFDLAIDIPAMGGFLYKILTVPLWLSVFPDAGVLYQAGYYEPYTKGIVPPKDWSPERFEAAKRILDFRLGHVGYVMEQHRAGAAFGAKACRSYKQQIAKSIAFENTVEATIFEMGFMHPSHTFEQLEARADLASRMPKGTSKPDLKTAFFNLMKKLQTPNVSATLDYMPLPLRVSRNVKDNL
jgi:hypothetical protein